MASTKGKYVLYCGIEVWKDPYNRQSLESLTHAELGAGSGSLLHEPTV